VHDPENQEPGTLVVELDGDRAFRAAVAAACSESAACQEFSAPVRGIFAHLAAAIREGQEMTQPAPGETTESFSGWAIVELMGHSRFAGYLTSQEIVTGRTFFRLDIPVAPPVTQFYGPQSVYRITPATESTVRRIATICPVAPVQSWELPEITPAGPTPDPWDAGEPAGTRL
jgi:hypothetical protein